MMVKPRPLAITPPIPLATLGGAVGVLLMTAILYLAPAAGIPLVDTPRLIGGVFTSDPAAAFGIGYAILFVAGWLVLSLLLAMFWSNLPGDALDLPGALLKGVLWGVILWAAAGLLLPLLGLLNRVDEVQNPGLFALGAGFGGAAFFLLAHLGYGVSVALISAMGRGLSPLESLGVEGYKTVGGISDHPATGVPIESTPG